MKPACPSMVREGAEIALVLFCKQKVLSSKSETWLLLRRWRLDSRGAAPPPLPDQTQAGAVGRQPASNGEHQSEGTRQNPPISK